MKTFFRRLFCGLGIIFLSLILFAGFSAYQLLNPQLEEIKTDTFLEIKLESKLVDQPLNHKVPFYSPSVSSLRDIILVLENASLHPHIKGIILHLENATFSGFAQIQELRNALHAFRKSGKVIYVYNESFGELSSGTSLYYLACVADEIWMHPLGSLNITGLASLQPFSRKLLDDIGIFPDIQTREEYKNAYDNIKEKQMTPANREGTQSLLDSLFKQIIKDVAKDRDLGEEVVLEAFQQAPYFTLETPLREGLIDKVAYKDMLYSHISSKWGQNIKYKEISQFPLKLNIKKNLPGPKIAVVFANGIIMRKEKGSNPLNPNLSMDIEAIEEAIDNILEDNEVKALVLRLDSPGGSPLISDNLWRLLQRVKEMKKPVIISMGDVAASGAYWLASHATKIVANPATITGSIGVITGKIASEKMWEKIGIHWDLVQTTTNASLWNMIHPFTDHERHLVKEMTDHIYETFIHKVSEGRHLSPEHVRQVAKGRVWTGEQALQWGLVDALGDLDTAIEIAKSEAKINEKDKKSVQIIYLPKARSFWEKFSPFLKNNLSLTHILTLSLKHSVLLITESLKKSLMDEPGMLLKAEIPSVN